ncbi:MAG: hypothetical protein K2L12_03365 [Clostridia bacterium]|nr:hypothetical protein [Clostridia bacterium]
MEENDSLTDEQKLEKAEKLIERKDLEQAQEMLDSVKENSGRKYFLQGKLFIRKSWYSEARKQFKFAIKAEPENEQYKKALEELETFCKSEEYKQMKTVQMGKNTEGCALVCCECCASGACQAICEGCCN